LIKRFAHLKDDLGSLTDITAEQIASLGPDVVAAVIAAGTGAPNDDAAEAAARTLGAQAELDLLAAIIGETMPGGLDPFLARVTQISKTLGVDMPDLADAVSQATAKTPSPPQSTN